MPIGVRGFRGVQHNGTEKEIDRKDMGIRREVSV
jgi:hypothetical protein